MAVEYSRPLAHRSAYSARSASVLGRPGRRPDPAEPGAPRGRIRPRFLFGVILLPVPAAGGVAPAASTATCATSSDWAIVIPALARARRHRCRASHRHIAEIMAVSARDFPDLSRRRFMTASAAGAGASSVAGLAAACTTGQSAGRPPGPGSRAGRHGPRCLHHASSGGPERGARPSESPRCADVAADRPAEPGQPGLISAMTRTLVFLVAPAPIPGNASPGMPPTCPAGQAAPVARASAPSPCWRAAPRRASAAM
jgi:hypothetical protein